jgi:hypothetical protein
MKACLNKAVVLAMAAVISGAPGSLLAQEKEHVFSGVAGGLSLFTGSSVDEMSFPGIYPNRPVFGVFFTDTDYFKGEYDLWAGSGKLEIFYLAQSSFYDYYLRDDLGNIFAGYKVECLRTFVQIDVLNKIRLSSKGRVTPVLLAGPALAIPLKTSRKPDVEDPPPDKYKRAILSLVFGVGLEAKAGKLLLSFDVRYDVGFDTLSWARLDPKPDALLIMAGIGF